MSQPPTPLPFRIDDVALDWALRMADPARADWDGFTDWLAQDPAHGERYDRIAAALLDAQDALAAHPEAVEQALARSEPEAEAEAAVRRERPVHWMGGAVAAALLATLGFGLWSERPRPYAVETAAGETRRIVLPDGSRIELAGGSRMRLDHADPRRAVVERGEALFRVRHDAAHPFTVQAGDLALTDLGTVFDVRLGERRTRVAVAEGAVMVDPKGAALRLDPGQAVVAEGQRLIRQPVAVEAVGGWSEGRLAYDDTPLSDVAEDLSRSLGRPVTVAPMLAERRFRGTLDVKAVQRDPRLLGRLLDVTVRVDGKGWMLAEGASRE
ncbi:FecR domain-containing protein [Sphingomonadaceae bacterium jetA1]|jgi:transmembrane sensor|uniref:FecR family protein n=1 Tax=Facivitalis istanbulensis TaxID=3075838 RepID=UPI00346BAD7F